jgi:hypothetical protein
MPGFSNFQLVGEIVTTIKFRFFISIETIKLSFPVTLATDLLWILRAAYNIIITTGLLSDLVAQYNGKVRELPV